MTDEELQEMFKRRTFLRGMYGRNPGAMRPDPSQPIALPPRQVPQMTPAPMPQPGRQRMFPSIEPGRPRFQSFTVGDPRERYLYNERFFNSAPMHALMGASNAVRGFSSFVQKFPFVGRLFGR